MNTTQDDPTTSEADNSPEKEASMAVYTKHDVNTLLATDRCDRCGAAAYGRAVLGDTELLFCAHHLAGSLEALLEAADYVHDFRGVLDAREEARRAN